MPDCVGVGKVQGGVDPMLLKPSRRDLSRARRDAQAAMIRGGVQRHTPILVNSLGIIVDGHHAVRAAADLGERVDVVVSSLPAKATADSILDLDVR